MTVDILPDSRLTTKKGGYYYKGLWWEPIFCANCGKDCGFVPTENMTFAFWLCDPCASKCGQIADHYIMPDELYWQKVAEVQLEQHGRLLTPHELQHALEDPQHPLHRLARERPRAS